MKVLLVDDNPLLCERVERMLQAIPAVEIVKIANDEPQATAWLKDHPDGWDLALVDLFLGQGHGFNVLRRCRSRQPHQKAVVFSNYTRDPVRQYAREAGADAVFDKSLDLEALLEYVAQLCRSTV
jgi:DNA-binding NarL/FixJ family response regulator